MNQKQVFSLIASLSGQANVLTIPRIFIDLTGSVESGLFLSQCIYWSDKTRDPGGWFYKTMEEWESEIGLKRTRLETAIRNTSGLIEIKKKRANGSPTLHFRVDFDALVQALETLTNGGNPTIGNVEISNSSSNFLQMEMQDSYNSLTETTPETTTQNARGDSEIIPEDSASLPGAWGMLTPRPGMEEKAKRIRVLPSPAALYNSWLNPELLDLGVAFTQATGIEPPMDKTSRSSWRKALADLDINHITPAEIVKTVEYMKKRGLSINNPWSIKNTTLSGAAEREKTQGTGFTRFVPGETQL